MEVYRVSPGAIADLLDALRRIRAMTNDVATIQFLRNVRLLEQRLLDAERVIEDRDQANDRQKRDLEHHRQHAMSSATTSGPRSSPKSSSTTCAAGTRARWQALADRIAVFY